MNKDQPATCVADTNTAHEMRQGVWGGGGGNPLPVFLSGSGVRDAPKETTARETEDQLRELRALQDLCQHRRRVPY